MNSATIRTHSPTEQMDRHEANDADPRTPPQASGHPIAATRPAAGQNGTSDTSMNCHGGQMFEVGCAVTAVVVPFSSGERPMEWKVLSIG